jgi:hypothetical protein
MAGVFQQFRSKSAYAGGLFNGTPEQAAGIPGLKSETWGTLRLLPTQRTE